MVYVALDSDNLLGVHMLISIQGTMVSNIFKVLLPIRFGYRIYLGKTLKMAELWA